MKTKFLSVLSLSLLLTIGSSLWELQAQVYISVYARIPLAPNVVLTVDVPVIAAPSPDYVWIDGYWTWDYPSRNYIWMQGYWALAPYPGAYWIPGYWERYRSGYRWINACWLPRNYYLNYGYFNGRYDYYGRPVYYHRPPANYSRGYAYVYDHNPNHRVKGYNSSPNYNAAPQRERERIDRQQANARSTVRESTRPQTENNSVRRANTTSVNRENTTPVRRENTSSINRGNTTPARRENTVSANRENTTPATRENARPVTSGNTKNENSQSVRSGQDSRNSTEVRENNSSRSGSRNESASAPARSSGNRESSRSGESGRNNSSRR